MGRQKRSSGRAKNKASKSVPQLTSKEQEEANTNICTPQHILQTIAKAIINLLGKLSMFNATEQGKALKVITTDTTTPKLPEQIIAEDVLVSIISRLKLREATRTSVLSRRWRHIWTRLPVFKFDATTIFDAYTRKKLFGENSLLVEKDKYELLLGKTEQFIGAVDSLIQQHQGDRVDEFMVAFFLHEIHSHRLDEWVRFAVAAKTKKLSLHLRQPFSRIFEDAPYFNTAIQLYNFPPHLLATSLVEELSLTYCSLELTLSSNVFNNLRRLALFGVEITEEDINGILLICSALEDLTLQYNQQWETLSIPHHLSQLRSLIVQDCLQLKKIEINPINVKIIRFRGLITNIIFNQSSQLDCTEIRLIANYKTRNLDYYLTKLHRNLPDLRSLIFHIYGNSKVTSLRKGSCSFIHLKFLDMTWSIPIKMNLFHLAALLDAAPFLEELRLQLWTRVVEKLPQSLTKLSEKLPKHPRTYLKATEISGFCFDKWQVEIALYILSNARELDFMTIKKDHNYSLEIEETDINYLSHEVPTNVKFAIV